MSSIKFQALLKIQDLAPDSGFSKTTRIHSLMLSQFPGSNLQVLILKIRIAEKVRMKSTQKSRSQIQEFQALLFGWGLHS